MNVSNARAAIAELASGIYVIERQMGYTNLDATIFVLSTCSQLTTEIPELNLRRVFADTTINGKKYASGEKIDITISDINSTDFDDDVVLCEITAGINSGEKLADKNIFDENPRTLVVENGIIPHNICIHNATSEIIAGGINIGTSEQFANIYTAPYTHFSIAPGSVITYSETAKMNGMHYYPYKQSRRDCVLNAGMNVISFYADLPIRYIELTGDSIPAMVEELSLSHGKNEDSAVKIFVMDRNSRGLFPGVDSNKIIIPFSGNAASKSPDFVYSGGNKYTPIFMHIRVTAECAVSIIVHRANVTTTNGEIFGLKYSV